MWIKKEAQKLLEKGGGTLTFSAGYGPSGLPHIGTFSEAFRVNCVMKAVQELDNKVKTKFLMVSDDMDALRKVPDNIPNRERFFDFLGMPLTSIPDPFGKHRSYGEAMNAKLISFLKLFGFEFEFKSATECYKKGLYDKHLLMILDKYEEVMSIMLPTLGEERRESYSPFLPICEDTGKVLQAKVTSVDKLNGKITYQNSSGKEVEVPVTGGKCKLQWKPDWGMRWAALNVNYEMHGKDLTPSAVVSSKICRAIGCEPPQLFVYELFLDQEGKKISKSKGNGISLDDWLDYAPLESLSLYLLQNPQRAKKLYFDCIPKSVDDFLQLAQQDECSLDQPIFYVKQDKNYQTHGINYTLLLNLARACNPENKEVLWGFIRNYAPNLSPKNNSFLDHLVDFAVKYYHDFVKPNKKYRTPSPEEARILKTLYDALATLKNESSLDASAVQNAVYRIAQANYENTKDFFVMLYQVLLGNDQGPRIGSFFLFYGLDNSLKLIAEMSSKTD